MSPGASRNSFRSCPTEKPRPAPVRTTARTSGSRASLSAAASPSCIAWLNAFSLSGRLRVIVRTPPSDDVSTSATRPRDSQPREHGKRGDQLPAEDLAVRVDGGLPAHFAVLDDVGADRRRGQAEAGPSVPLGIASTTAAAPHRRRGNDSDAVLLVRLAEDL